MHDNYHCLKYLFFILLVITDTEDNYTIYEFRIDVNLPKNIFLAIELNFFF